MREKILVHFRWTIHNLVGHPALEVLHLVGLDRLGQRVHDATDPGRS